MSGLIHEHLIKAADAPHPGLIFSIGEPNSFLVVEAAKSPDGHVLIAQLVNAKGSVLHEQRVLAIQSNVEREAGREQVAGGHNMFGVCRRGAGCGR